VYDIMAANAANRINARLDNDLARKVELVRKRTKRSVSQIVKESLTSYCDAELGQARTAGNGFQTAGFVGCAEGPADYSSNYKAELARSLKRKT
jgi:hypothetical protein